LREKVLERGSVQRRGARRSSA